MPASTSVHFACSAATCSLAVSFLSFHCCFAPLEGAVLSLLHGLAAVRLVLVLCHVR